MVLKYFDVTDVVVASYLFLLAFKSSTYLNP